MNQPEKNISVEQPEGEIMKHSYYVMRSNENEFQVWTKNDYEHYIRQAVRFGAGSAFKIITGFNGDEDYLLLTSQPQSSIKAEQQDEKDKEIKRLKFKLLIMEGENRKLRDDKLNIQKDAGLDPYWHSPQCDVEGCEQVSCCGGICWRETGYWSVCPDHSAMHRKGEPQPQMKQSAIDKEKTRDENGYLPSI